MGFDAVWFVLIRFDSKETNLTYNIWPLNISSRFQRRTKFDLEYLRDQQMKAYNIALSNIAASTSYSFLSPITKNEPRSSSIAASRIAYTHNLLNNTIIALNAANQ